EISCRVLEFGVKQLHFAGDVWMLKRLAPRNLSGQYSFIKNWWAKELGCARQNNGRKIDLSVQGRREKSFPIFADLERKCCGQIDRARTRKGKDSMSVPRSGSDRGLKLNWNGRAGSRSAEQKIFGSVPDLCLDAAGVILLMRDVDLALGAKKIFFARDFELLELELARFQIYFGTQPIDLPIK